MPPSDDHPVRGFLTLGFFLTVAGIALAFITPRDSGEFVASVCSAAMGLFLVAGSVVMVRLMRPKG